MEGARELLELAPDRFRLPDEAGLVEFIRHDLRPPADTATLSLVAEIDGQVVGSVEARLQEPMGSARFQVLNHLSKPRVYVNHLRVDPAFRRRGVGSSLMQAVERWARASDAASAALDTFVDSPLSVPFYEAVGYKRTSIVFEKDLD
jgi:GNAT superfamily N-acetyltransferase